MRRFCGDCGGRLVKRRPKGSGLPRWVCPVCTDEDDDPDDPTPKVVA